MKFFTRQNWIDVRPTAVNTDVEMQPPVRLEEDD